MKRFLVLLVVLLLFGANAYAADGDLIVKGNFNLLPAGTMVMYGGAAAPAGWLLADGSAVSRTTYATLFAAIGTTYGAGDGSTTFNVPDMRGRIPAGVGTGRGGGASGTGLPIGGSTLTAIARGTWKGEETHQLSAAELASHTHSQQSSTLLASGPLPWTPAEIAPGNGSYGGEGGITGATGSNTAHNNIQPVMGVNFIIKL